MVKLSTATENGLTKIRVYDSLRDLVGGRPAVEMSESEACRALLAHADLLAGLLACESVLVTVAPQYADTIGRARAAIALAMAD